MLAVGWRNSHFVGSSGPERVISSLRADHCRLTGLYSGSYCPRATMMDDEIHLGKQPLERRALDEKRILRQADVAEPPPSAANEETVWKTSNRFSYDLRRLFGKRADYATEGEAYERSL